eukprot:m.197026 g.197026  ORF g.197026 m.197026 type:complete len:311 (-) comp18707_c0_seq3:271-1203(-)
MSSFAMVVICSALLLCLVDFGDGASMQMKVKVRFSQSPSPPNAVELDVYHVNPANYTGISNMNSGDAAGDAFFDLRSPALYYMCVLNRTNAKNYPPGFCDNPEVVAEDLAITQVSLAVDPQFAQYSACNVCIDGHVPFTNPPLPCVDGTYHCVCGASHNEPCSPLVGNVDVRASIQSAAGRMHLDQAGPADHWYVNLAVRTGGQWYSTVGEGNCDNPDHVACAWKLIRTIKKISATCHSARVRAAVEALGTACFSACGSDRHSMCYIDCYYATLLGPAAGHTYPSTGGLSQQKIVSIWTDAFAACPDISA